MMQLESQLGMLVVVMMTLFILSDNALNKSVELKEERIRVLESRLDDVLAENQSLKEVRSHCIPALLIVF